MNQDVQSEINRLVHRLKQDQSADGSWNYPFDTGITADAYMIILLKILDMEDTPLIEALVKESKASKRKTGHGNYSKMRRTAMLRLRSRLTMAFFLADSAIRIIHI